MKQTLYDRRNFLMLGGMAVATVAAISLPRFTWAQIQPVQWDECLAMSPESMAANSRLVMDSLDYINRIVGTITDQEMKRTVRSILDNPAPTIMTPLMDSKTRHAVYDELKSTGLIDTTFDDFLPTTDDPTRSPQPFLSAPGSGYASHHSYPGGLITHTALNLQASLAIHEGYKNIYGIELDRDTVIVSQVLHDLHKPWVFQWESNGALRAERKLAGTGEHHPLSVAESFKRGIPASICIAQACAHTHPGFDKDEAEVVAWIKAAAILNGIDPIRAGLLAPSGATLPVPRRMEGFICHLGDHDYVLTVPAAKWLIPAMQKIAAQHYGIDGESADAV